MKYGISIAILLPLLRPSPFAEISSALPGAIDSPEIKSFRIIQKIARISDGGSQLSFGEYGRRQSPPESEAQVRKQFEWLGRIYRGNQRETANVTIVDDVVTTVAHAKCSGGPGDSGGAVVLREAASQIGAVTMPDSSEPRLIGVNQGSSAATHNDTPFSDYNYSAATLLVGPFRAALDRTVNASYNKP